MTPSNRESRPCISGRKATFATIIVGEEKESFLVHENLLTYYSEFFRAALTGGFKEAGEKTVKIEDDVQVFEFFYHWLYYQRWPSKEQGDDPAFVAEWESDFSVYHLVTLYVLADRYGIPQLRKDTIDELFDSVYNGKSHLPGPGTAQYAFRWLPPKSPMCRFIVDAFCHYGYKGNYDPCFDDNKRASEWPQDFLLQSLRRSRLILSSLRYEGSELQSFDPNICDYHEHKSDEEKVACKTELDQKQKQKK